MKRRLLLVSAVTVALILPAAGASAYKTNGLLANYDMSDPTSFTPETMALVNTGSAGGSATKVGNVTFDETDQALVFPGTGFNKDYYNLGPGFANFGTGISIQANFNFGRTATKWERIFDFSNGAGSDNFLVGQYLTDGEIFVEVWDNNVRNGRCRSETGGTALKGNVFAEWTITLDGATCHIYKDGVELKTSVSTRSAIGTFSTPVANGSPFTVLPRNVTRTVNRLGASAWSGDQDSEGKLKYLRIYNAALTPDQVANNFNLSLTPVNQAVSGLKGTSLTTSTITPTGFTNAPTFSVSPALPAGLTLNTSTGVVSGTPTVTLPATPFTVTASDAALFSNEISAVVTITVTETPASANTPNRTKLASTGANTSAWMGSGLILGVAGLILVVATRLHKLKHVLRSTQK